MGVSTSKAFLSGRLAHACIMLGAICVWLISALLSSPLFAQQQSPAPIEWSDPVQLSEDQSLPNYPTIAIDPWGGVHIFWAEAAAETNSNNLITYLSQEGGNWGAPTDVIAGVDHAGFSWPYAVGDDGGMLHLIWAAFDGLYYSSAFAADAENPRAWKRAQPIVAVPQVYQSRMAVDQEGVLHVVFTIAGSGGNAFYVRSEDGGVNWSLPVQLSEVHPSDEFLASEARLAIDSNDNLHVAWTQSYPPEFLGRRVFYVRSLDGGASWQKPLDLSGPPTEKDVNHHPSIAVDSQDRVHLVWAGGPDGSNRLYRSSTDGGETWSGSTQIFGNKLGWGGYDSMFNGSDGTIYWAGLLRYPQGFYFNYLTDGRWNEPPILLIDEEMGALLAEAHFPQIVVGRDNRVRIAFVEGDQGATWYMEGKTSLPSYAPLPRPSPTELPTAATADTPAPTPQPDRIVLGDTDAAVSSSPGPGSMFMLFLTIVPTLMLVLVVFLVHARRTR